MGADARPAFITLVPRSARVWLQLAAGDAGRALGRLAVLRARLGSRCVSRNLNMFTLIALGTGAAYLYSVVATLVPGVFPERVPHARTARSPSTSKRPR